jgi:beta-galactosidase
MQRRTLLKLTVLGAAGTLAGKAMRLDAAAAGGVHERVPDGRPHRFELARQQFLLDGKPFQIRSGEMHPVRMPAEHWRQRIRMAKAMGLNTIAIYVVWNALESEPGVFDLKSGNRDFVRFIALCAEEGMWVYLRPGPYICGEWDFGGLPPYLLRDPTMRVRDKNNAHYMQAVTRYLDTIAPLVAPLMAARGGPILLLQVENEYASFGKDLGYLEQLRAMWQARGIDGPFSISDGLGQLREAGTYLPGAVLGLDGDTDFKGGQAIAGEAPVWVGEGYPGWLTHWGEPDFQHADYLSTLQQLLEQGRSFNLYVVHGGTNFGFGAGANAHGNGSTFEPVITSYDYGAPINEQGAPTPAYRDFRAAIGKATGQRLPAIPATPATIAWPAITPTPWASLWDNLPTARRVDRPQPNELLFAQDHGLVLYRKPVPAGRMLQIDGVHDYATVFADGRYLDHISRVQKPGLHVSGTIALPSSVTAAFTLDILVDSFGHVGYGPDVTDRKGLTGSVHLDGHEVRDWEAYSLPLDDAFIGQLKPSTSTTRPGIFFRAELHLDRAGDSYLDMSAWNKGYLWVNGHLLGRYWHIGPQQRLYCPVSWLRAGRNEVLVLDLHRTEPAPIVGARTLSS